MHRAAQPSALAAFTSAADAVAAWLTHMRNLATYMCAYICVWLCVSRICVYAAAKQ